MQPLCLSLPTPVSSNPRRKSRQEPRCRVDNTSNRGVLLSKRPLSDHAIAAHHTLVALIDCQLHAREDDCILEEIDGLADGADGLEMAEGFTDVVNSAAAFRQDEG